MAIAISKFINVSRDYKLANLVEEEIKRQNK
jgi:hypothetical protein